MIKIKFRLKDKVDNRLVFVPLTGYDVSKHDKKTGKKLTVKELEKKLPSEVETRRILNVNTDFWKETPSARFEVVADDSTKIKDLNVGDEFEMVLKKV